jgi:hypothetical protein
MNTKSLMASAAVVALGAYYIVELLGKANDFSPSRGDSRIKAIEDSPIFSTVSDSYGPMGSSGEEMSIVSTTIMTVDNTKDQTIEGPEGTKLVFPKGIFVDQSGNGPSGNVRIELQECYAYADMIKSKLSTTSDGKLLETAGMIHVRAFSAGTELKIKDGMSYTIEFPKNGEKRDDFKLFYGAWKDNGNINWILADDTAAEKPALVDGSADVTASATAPTAATPESNCFIQVHKSYLRTGTKIRKMDHYNWQLSNGQTLNSWFVSSFNPDLEMLNDFCGRGLFSEISFTVDSLGRFKDYYISKPSERPYDLSIAEFLKNMPALDIKRIMPVYTYDHKIILEFGKRVATEQVEIASMFKAKHAKELDKPMIEASLAELDYFVLSASQLGWINCDRFAKEEKTTDYVVHVPDPANSSVSMVFEDLNSVLKGSLEGNQIVFHDVPLGKKVKLIGITSRGNQPTMSQGIASTKEKSARLKDFKPFTVNELEAVFAKAI